MMKRFTFLFAVLILATTAGAISAALVGEYPSVSGVLGMAPVSETSCAAVWVPVGKNQALAGVTWYNNDGLAVFPEVLVVGGSNNEVLDLAACSVVADHVTGPSSAWSTVAFEAPLVSKSGGFFVLFRFPEGSEHVAVGTGGGAGIGYVENGGLTGWMSADGEDWMKVGRAYGFAVLPELVPAESWMASKSGRMYEPPVTEQLPEAELFVTTLLPAAPNPFNPKTTIGFRLNDETEVRISIYDMKGRKVVDLVNQTYSAGEHAVFWEGCDRSGKRVSSGAYFVHMNTDAEEFAQRIMLVK